MEKQYLFKVTLQGEGNTPEEAWADAVEAFSQTPGEPHETIVIKTIWVVNTSISAECESHLIEASTREEAEKIFKETYLDADIDAAEELFADYSYSIWAKKFISGTTK